MEYIQQSTNANNVIVPKLANSILEKVEDSCGGHSDKSRHTDYFYTFCNGC